MRVNQEYKGKGKNLCDSDLDRPQTNSYHGTMRCMV
jgi:hypothetical protein